jgi:hypothetical protein
MFPFVVLTRMGNSMDIMHSFCDTYQSILYLRRKNQSNRYFQEEKHDSY